MWYICCLYVDSEYQLTCGRPAVHFNSAVFLQRDRITSFRKQGTKKEKPLIQHPTDPLSTFQTELPVPQPLFDDRSMNLSEKEIFDLFEKMMVSFCLPAMKIQDTNHSEPQALWPRHPFWQIHIINCCISCYGCQLGHWATVPDTLSGLNSGA